MNAKRHYNELATADINADTSALFSIFTNPSAPSKARRYAGLKRAAILARLAGRIPEALDREAVAESAYRGIPEAYRW